MNQQTQWKIVADRQQNQSIQRNREEMLYKQRLKQAYMAELSNQMKINEEVKKRQKSLQKWEEKQIIQKSIQHQKKQIQSERVRAMVLGQKQERIDMQNEMLQKMKREQADLVKKIQHSIQIQGSQQARRAEEMRKNEQFRKRQELRRSLQSSIETNKQHKSFSQRMEKEYQLQQLNEGQNRKLRDEVQRMRFYHGLRERAKQVDYGSHSSFEQKNNKTLVQRKKQEWNIYKDSIEMQQKMRQTEEKSRIHRLMLQNQYRQELKRQIDQRANYSKNKAQYDLENDRKTINYSQQLSDRAYLTQKQRQEQHKKMLAEYLRFQADTKAKQRQESQQMKDHQMRLNLNILASDNGITSIDTFQLDSRRKKQLETIQKSLLPSRYATIDAAQNSKLNYFANKGINLIK